ncbi:MAG TPA: aldehyde dehydrogenase family protein [Acidimicrobiales bacterium]|nr:aldehyde dehydrogenase family protein [Acidimicrobiales bacterium]MDP7208767.1 aldehyde dehydrogenase family protein [Acidimicrobiales bacterium]HJL90411.1 aldehyde dehydrogenase family protein [Acidimicrobiales bacterium]HJO99927.1 aldehyde dehydrogenase family protein [Acidimicrobiales bacterium]
MAAEHPRSDVVGVKVSVDHFINGARVPSPTTFEDRSPLDWSVQLADVSAGDAVTADAAVTAATAAFPEWAGLGATGRAVILRRLADLVDENVPDIAAVECMDMAMRHESLRERVISRGARNFRAYADLAEAYEERRWSSNGTANLVQRMPAGPSVVITPWNAPFMLATWKVAPALAAGNTVVLKPAEWSPLSASLLADLAAEAGMPPGVFNVVQGIGEEVGPPLVSDRRIRRISFTGSPETARVIGAAAAANIVPFTAELGGKGPLVVLADADLDAAATVAVGQYGDSGQVCLAGTRLLVAEEVAEDFLERFNVLVDALVLGDSRDDATDITPMIHPDHLVGVEAFVDRAREAGDTVLRGGKRLTEDGLWYEPTLISPLSNESEIVQREVFGPVLTFQTFADEDEVVPLANSTEYGLSATLFTGSADKAEHMGRAFRAGTVWVNCFLVRDLTAPFGGCGISGLGREGGDYALDFQSDLTTLQIRDGST